MRRKAKGLQTIETHKVKAAESIPPPAETKGLQTSAENGNRRCGGKGAYTEIRNRADVPHVAVICARMQPRRRQI